MTVIRKKWLMTNLGLTGTHFFKEQVFRFELPVLFAFAIVLER